MDLCNKEFDLRTAAEKGAWMQLVHPVTGDELGVKENAPSKIMILGADSVNYEQAVARTVAFRSREQAPKKGSVTEKQILDAADKNAEFQAEELAAITLDWTNIEWNGESLKFDHDNAVMLYREHKWVRDQVIDFFADRTNYLGNV